MPGQNNKRLKALGHLISETEDRWLVDTSWIKKNPL